MCKTEKNIYNIFNLNILERRGLFHGIAKIQITSKFKDIIVNEVTWNNFGIYSVNHVRVCSDCLWDIVMCSRYKNGTGFFHEFY